MKKLLFSLSLIIASFACFAQQNILLENASNCAVRVELVEVVQGSCSFVSTSVYTVNPGASVPATVSSSSNEFVHAEVTDASSSCFGAALDTDGFPTCVTCPGYGAPTSVSIATGCASCQPILNVVWDSNCGGQAHMHIF